MSVSMSYTETLVEPCTACLIHPLCHVDHNETFVVSM